jgi:hypothetical protein
MGRDVVRIRRVVRFLLVQGQAPAAEAQAGALSRCGLHGCRLFSHLRGSRQGGRHV